MSDVQVSMSPTIGALAAALAKAQAAMTHASKDAVNPHFKNRYASLPSIIEACKPLSENGIAILQPPVPHGQDGVCVVTMLVHSSGEWMRGELYMPVTKRDAQGFGSALSYARRYCLQSMVCLGADDEDGEAAVGQRPGPAKVQLQQVDTSRLEASVQAAWPKWEEKCLGMLTSAQSIPDLMAAWADVEDERLRIKPPDELVTRIAQAKDERKKALSRALRP